MIPRPFTGHEMRLCLDALAGSCIGCMIRTSAGPRCGRSPNLLAERQDPSPGRSAAAQLVALDRHGMCGVQPMKRWR